MRSSSTSTRGRCRVAPCQSMSHESGADCAAPPVMKIDLAIVYEVEGDDWEKKRSRRSSVDKFNPISTNPAYATFSASPNISHPLYTCLAISKSRSPSYGLNNPTNPHLLTLHDQAKCSRTVSSRRAYIHIERTYRA